jgi:hypothetical protein
LALLRARRSRARCCACTRIGSRPISTPPTALPNLGFRIRDTADQFFPYDMLDRVVALDSLEYGYGSGRRPQLYLEIVAGVAPTRNFWTDPARIPSGGSSAALGDHRRDDLPFDAGRLGIPEHGNQRQRIVLLRVSSDGLGCSGSGRLGFRRTVLVTVPTRLTRLSATALVSLRARSRGGARFGERAET